MKQIFFLTILLLSLGPAMRAQDSCKVLMPSLQGSYSGGCKKGLANGYGTAKGKDSYQGYFHKGLPHGYGIYKWSSGEVYKGMWDNGKREGEGSFTFKIDGKDSTVTGLWKDDVYVGHEVKEPEIIQVKNIDNYSFSRGSTGLNRILIDFKQNGMTNTSVSELMISADSGTETKIGNMPGYENITFPVRVKVRYNTFNKLRSVEYNCVIEFTLYQKGDWILHLNN